LTENRKKFNEFEFKKKHWEKISNILNFFHILAKEIFFSFFEKFLVFFNSVGTGILKSIASEWIYQSNLTNRT